MAGIGNEPGWVIGGSGFLGTAVVSSAVASGVAVTSVGRAPSRVAGVPSLTLDVAGLDGHLEELFQDRQPPWSVLCTALPSVAACEQDPDLARRLNVVLPQRLARLSHKLGSRLVHISTDNVFDGEPSRATGFREDDETRPLSLYGATKREGELAVSNEDPGALVVRLPLLFGDSRGRGTGGER